MALNSLSGADVPLRNYSLTHPTNPIPILNRSCVHGYL